MRKIKLTLEDIRKIADRVILEKKGLWDNIRAKRKRGEAPAKRGDEDYPDKESWEKAQENYSEWERGIIINEGNVKLSKELQYHIDNKISLGECVFRYGSHKWFSLIREAKSLYRSGLINLNENDKVIVQEFSDKRVRLKEVGEVYLDFIYEEIEPLNEAKYKGETVELNKPKRGGSKKFYVYVKDGDKVKKVSFGAKSGGGKLAVKLKDPKARKAFADRHNCETKNDKTTPGYWSCRLPRYAKMLGLSGGGTWW